MKRITFAFREVDETKPSLCIVKYKLFDKLFETTINLTETKGFSTSISLAHFHNFKIIIKSEDEILWSVSFILDFDDVKQFSFEKFSFTCKISEDEEQTYNKILLAHLLKENAEYKTNIEEKTKLIVDLEDLVYNLDVEKEFLIKTQDQYSELMMENSMLKKENVNHLRDLEEMEIIKRRNEGDLMTILRENKVLNIFDVPVESLKRGAKRVLDYIAIEIENGKLIQSICQKNEIFEMIFFDNVLTPFISLTKDGLKKAWYGEYHFWNVLTALKHERLSQLISTIKVVEKDNDLNVLNALKLFITYVCILFTLGHVVWSTFSTHSLKTLKFWIISILKVATSKTSNLSKRFEKYS